jgi:hypothetical protein
MSNQPPTTTADAGCPVASDEYSLTVAAWPKRGEQPGTQKHGGAGDFTLQPGSED